MPRHLMSEGPLASSSTDVMQGKGGPLERFWLLLFSFRAMPLAPGGGLATSQCPEPFLPFACIWGPGSMSPKVKVLPQRLHRLQAMAVVHLASPSTAS